jgi:hypothetical protein
MRVLTIFTVILLPLSLIAGIYGMNGVDINKIDTLPSGFLSVIVMMAVVGVGLLVFIKKQWLLVQEKNGNDGVHHQKTGEQNNHTNNKNSHISYQVWKSGQ